MRSTSDHDAHRALPGDVAPPTDTEFDDTEHLVPILDVDRTAGWYEGWRYEFSYVSFRGEISEVHDVKTLFNRVLKRLWT